MKRPIRPEEARLWAHVAATVHPAAGRSHPEAPGDAIPTPAPGRAPGRSAPGRTAVVAKASVTVAAPAASRRKGDPETIEPARKRRIIRGRESLEARIDLHGLDYDGAQATLEAFVRRAWNDGYRACLVITGKGTRGDGVLRRFTPEWLAAPSLRDIVAGISEADRRHGGEGALYVALKRRPRD
ncbi:MAG: mismatch repair protein MutS [Caulobacter sp.]|nr:mismatch repair protein MutS [Caulobacter sp.]